MFDMQKKCTATRYKLFLLLSLDLQLREISSPIAGRPAESEDLKLQVYGGREIVAATQENID